jgi:serine/threonine protein kinase/tetratricopeptide (TPR) repeat protein
MREELAAGDQLGRYTLVRKVGQGGAGEVWQALLHGPMGFRKPVALKLVRADGRVVGREEDLVQEARYGALMAHPNVVATYELGAFEGRRFIAMEFVDGPTLRSLAPEGRLPPRALLDVGEQAALGLAHIHGLRLPGAPDGLVHRDVKPSNLLVDRAGVVKVADLGIARLATQADFQDEVAGTPGYMAPEQFDGAADHRADLFALGATLFALCIGERPFGVGRKALFRTLKVEDLLADGLLDDVDARVPGLGELLHDLLRFHPDDRLESAAHVVAAVRRIRGALPEGPTLASLLSTSMPQTEANEPTRGRTTRQTTVPPGGPLLGRSLELGDLQGQVEAAPGWWTLRGPGGVGKTHLATALAGRVDLPGGGRVVDLQPVGSLSGLCAAVADALQIALRQDPVSQIGRALEGLGRALIVFDNVEHLAEHTDVLARWATGAPELSVVATSRRALDVPGCDVELWPLRTADAVALFRARAGRPVPRDQLPEVQRIVERLDGLPLAVELAAARMRRLAPADILAGLESRLRLSGVEGRPGLSHSFELSWELLEPWEKDALVQFSVFADGATLRAANALLDLSRWADAPWTPEVLDSLRRQSLLGWDARRQRYTMLQTVRELARARLDDPELVRRHARWYAQLGTAEMLAERRRDPALARAYRADLPNLLLAHRRTLADGERTGARLTALAAHAVLMDAGPREEATRLLEETVALDPHPDVLMALGTCHRLARQPDLAVGTQRRALARAREGGRTDAVVRAQLFLARALYDAERQPEAAPLVDQLLHTASAAGLDDELHEGLYLQGLIANCEGDRATARERFTRSLAYGERVRDLSLVSKSRDQLSHLASRAGRLEEAEQHLRASLHCARDVQDDSGVAYALNGLAGIEMKRCRFDEAHATFRRAARIFARIGYRREHLMAALNSALPLCHLRRTDEADAANREAARLLTPDAAYSNRTLLAMNQAFVSLLRKDAHGALLHTQRALAFVEASGRRGAFNVYAFRAGALALADRAKECEVLLQQALDCCHDNPSLVAATCAHVAENLAYAGRPDRAAELLERAERQASRVERPGFEAHMLRYARRAVRDRLASRVQGPGEADPGRAES